MRAKRNRNTQSSGSHHIERMDNALERLPHFGDHFVFHCCSPCLVLPRSVASEISVPDRNIVVGFCFDWSGRAPHYSDDSKLPGNQSRTNESGEEFEVGVRIRLLALGCWLLANANEHISRIVFFEC